jgi:hypothetical protein
MACVVIQFRKRAKIDNLAAERVKRKVPMIAPAGASIRQTVISPVICAKHQGTINFKAPEKALQSGMG